jgi:DNA-binding PucR family transcriptional regulator
MKPSLCCPIRWDGRLLGYLWVIDGNDPLDRHHLNECDDAARDIAALLREKEFLAHASRRTQRRLLLGLVAGPCDEVERSATEAERRNLLVADSDVVVLVAEARADDDGPVTAAVRDALDAATERCSRLAPARRALAAMHGDRGILLVALEQRRGADEAPRYADRLHECLVESFGRLADWTPIVGIGSPVDGLPRAAESYERACAAARVAQAMDDLGPVTSWSGLGVFRALSSIPPARVATLCDIHEGLATLAETPTGTSLIATVETYLDLGADARAAARALHLHRSSLYYRLSKCEAVAGINLRDGGDRLSFHLAVKLARLSGHLERTAATG